MTLQGPKSMTHGTLDFDAAVRFGFTGAALSKYIYIAEVNLYDEEKVLNVCFNGTVSARRVKLRGRN